MRTENRDICILRHDVMSAEWELTLSQRGKGILVETNGGHSVEGHSTTSLPFIPR